MHWLVRCPAKLNLFLSVGPIDRRGYHPLRTIFQAVSLFDTLTVSAAEKDEVQAPGLPEDNTLTRTLRLLKEVVELPPLRVVLDKYIPMESGLGGGSSDAAGLIRAAKAIAKMPIPEAELMGLAQTIGADVPFFLVGGRAIGEGYGERLTPLTDPEPIEFVLAKPSTGSASKAAYDRLDRLTYEWAVLDDMRVYNDFERVAPAESLELIQRMRVMGGRDVGLTGSGSAVFGTFDDPEEARRQLADAGYWSVRARTLSREASLGITLES